MKFTFGTFIKRRLTPSEAGRELALLRVENERERIKARTRWLREQCGMPDDPRLA